MPSSTSNICSTKKQASGQVARVVQEWLRTGGRQHTSACHVPTLGCGLPPPPDLPFIGSAAAPALWATRLHELKVIIGDLAPNLVEGSFYASTRAGMAHAHLLSTWFNANGNAAAPIYCPRSTIAPESPPNCRFLKKKLKDSKGFQFVSLRPENQIFCFKVPEMSLKAHASSAVAAKNRSSTKLLAQGRYDKVCEWPVIHQPTYGEELSGRTSILLTNTVTKAKNLNRKRRCGLSAVMDDEMYELIRRMEGEEGR